MINKKIFGLGIAELLFVPETVDAFLNSRMKVNNYFIFLPTNLFDVTL